VTLVILPAAGFHGGVGFRFVVVFVVAGGVFAVVLVVTRGGLWW